MGFFDSIIAGGSDPYGGLLDAQARKQAMLAGISGFGDAILSQGYSRVPRGMFQGIGQGMTGFTQARDDALQQALRAKLLTRQIGREDVKDARDTERFGMEKETFGITKDKAGREAKKFDTDFAEQDRTRQAQAKLSAALADAARRGMTNPSSDPAVMQALSEFQPTAAFTAMEKDTKPDYMPVGEGASVFDKRSGKFVTAPGGGGGGPFRGASMEAQDTNILLTGDPSSPVYAAAYNRQAQPRMTFDPGTGQLVQIKPDMSAYRQPGRPQQGMAVQPQIVDRRAAPGRPPVDAPPDVVPGLNIQQVAAPKLTEGQKNKLASAHAGAASIIASLGDFLKTRKNATAWEKGKSLAGINTPLNTAFNSAALLSKSEELFNLGVLNGPDLQIIRRTLADPSTVGGTIASQEDVEQSVKKIKALLKSRVNAMETALNQPLTKFDDEASGPDGDVPPDVAAILDKYAPRGRLPDEAGRPQVPIR